jgi:hypothetical protein
MNNLDNFCDAKEPAVSPRALIEEEAREHKNFAGFFIESIDNEEAG